MDPTGYLTRLDRFPVRPQDRFAISDEDKRIYREALFPYWEKRSMKDVINAQMTDEVKAAVRTQIFSINQTDKGQGHIIIDYPRLLNKGLAALTVEMKTLARQHPENDFLSGGADFTGGLAAPHLRYATLAADMARRCNDPQRRQELEAMPLIRVITPSIAGGFLAGLPAVLVHEHHSAVQVQRQFDFAWPF